MLGTTGGITDPSNSLRSVRQSIKKTSSNGPPPVPRKNVRSFRASPGSRGPLYRERTVLCQYYLSQNADNIRTSSSPALSGAATEVGVSPIIAGQRSFSPGFSNSRLAGFSEHRYQAVHACTQLSFSERETQQPSGAEARGERVFPDQAYFVDLFIANSLHLRRIGQCRCYEYRKIFLVFVFGWSGLGLVGKRRRPP
jgi:hypothetical protein